MKNKLKKLAISVGLLASMTIMLSSIALPAFAAGTVGESQAIGDLRYFEKEDKLHGKAPINLPSFDVSGQHADAPVEAGVSQIGSAGFFLIDTAKYVVGTIAFFMLIVSAIRFITAGKEVEEVMTKQKDNIKYSIMALIIVMLADPLVKNVFFGAEGEVLTSETYAKQFASAGVTQVMGVVRFVEAFVAAVAVLMIIYSGVRIMALGFNEEERTKHIKHILYAAAGLVLVGLSELIVIGIFFPQKGNALPNLAAARDTILNLTNFATGFIAFVSIAIAVYGGYLYVMGAANEENTQKAKKVLFGALVGILVAIGAFAIANTLIPKAEDVTPIQVGEGENVEIIVQPEEGEL